MNIFEFVREVVINMFVLLGFASLCAIRSGCASHKNKQIPKWQFGLLFGIMGVVAMSVPFVLQRGLIFDSRSAVIGTAALIGGPVAAITSLIFPAAYRFYVGPPGTIPGLIEIIMPALFGSLCYMVSKKKGQAMNLRKGLIYSLLVGFSTTVTITFFVAFAMPELFKLMSDVNYLTVYIINAPLAMALLSSLIILEQRHFNAIHTLADSERRMLHSQKMAAVGQLSRKLAHTFANSLTTILGNTQLAKEQAGDRLVVKKLMDEIIGCGAHVSRLTAELLAFSSPSGIRKRPIRLDKCIQGIPSVLRDSIGTEMDITVKADRDAGTVNVDPDRIEQAILHIAVNASEAMSGHGRFNISATRAKLSEKDKIQLQAGVHEKDYHLGDFALLSITDNGCGMTGETLLKIFEPFFTTKQDRQNAGLGLSTVYNIVQQHNGFIDVHSEQGKGTTLLIYLPVRENK